MKRNNYYSGRSKFLLEGVDWGTILIYIMLVLLGWLSIYAAVYNEEHASMFDMSQKYGAQIFWIGICSVAGLGILLIDSKYFYYFSYHLYLFLVFLSIGVLFGGDTINGAKSWISLGAFSIQPAEFAKVSTALALAKYMSMYSFNIRRFTKIAGIFTIIAIPALVIIFQNDTGSALVFGAFLIMFYREGLNSWLYVILFIMITVFLFSFIVTPIVLLYTLFLLLVALEVAISGNVKYAIKYIASTTLIYMFFVGLKFILEWGILYEYLFLISFIISLIICVVYYYKQQIKISVIPAIMFFGASLYSFSVDYMFNTVMKIHQQKRILDLLGLESDVKRWGYNVNQSKIAIGSGGFSGKGFLNGTQTKFNFVPEQSTDFIFCTISEEWGFIGSLTVITLFVALILRLMIMGDRQNNTFGRVYCYAAASILTFHVSINIGMTIGLLPVIGIPLPFFSYGGSSLLAFTILLFIAIKLDHDRKESINNLYS